MLLRIEKVDSWGQIVAPLPQTPIYETNGRWSQYSANNQQHCGKVGIYLGQDIVATCISEEDAMSDSKAVATNEKEARDIFIGYYRKCVEEAQERLREAEKAWNDTHPNHDSLPKDKDQVWNPGREWL